MKNGKKTSRKPVCRHFAYGHHFMSRLVNCFLPLQFNRLYCTTFYKKDVLPIFRRFLCYRGKSRFSLKCCWREDTQKCCFCVFLLHILAIPTARFNFEKSSWKDAKSFGINVVVLFGSSTDLCSHPLCKLDFGRDLSDQVMVLFVIWASCCCPPLGRTRSRGRCRAAIRLSYRPEPSGHAVHEEVDGLDIGGQHGRRFVLLRHTHKSQRRPYPICTSMSGNVQHRCGGG